MTATVCTRILSQVSAEQYSLLKRAAEGSDLPTADVETILNMKISDKKSVLWAISLA